MVWTPLLLGDSLPQDMPKGKGRYSGGFRNPLGGPLSKRVPQPQKGLRTIWGSGKKGGQGWGETLAITMVEQGAVNSVNIEIDKQNM